MSIRHPDPIEEKERPLVLETFLAGAAIATGYPSKRRWTEPTRGYSGVPHNNANRKKKAKRKQAQASRRNNRR